MNERRCGSETTRAGACVLLALATIVAAPLSATSAPRQAAPNRTVLTLHWGTPSFVSTPVLDEGIRQSLTSRPDLAIDYFSEYLESDRFPAEQLSLAFADYLRRKYRGRTIDLVIASTDITRDFALDHRNELFPDAPIVSAGISAPDDATRRAGAGLTVMVHGLAYAKTLNLALKLHPSTEDVFVVASNPDPRNVELLRAELNGFADRVRVTFLDEATVAALMARIRRVPPRSIILYVWHSREEQPGHSTDSAEVARLVAQAAPVPVYGTNDRFIGTGVVGGVTRGTRETGRRLGDTALRILDGTKAGDIPIEAEYVRPVFDWRAMQRWRVDERLLPADSVVSFRAPSLWRDYRREALIAIGGLSIQSMLIVGLLYERRARRRAEVESRRSLALAADADRRATMSALTGSMAHDLSQPLNAILHNVRAGELLVTSNRATPDILRELLSDIRTADVRATQIVERHRTMLKAHELDKKPVDIHGVVRESVALVAHDTGRKQIHVDLDLPPDPCFVVGDHVLLQQVLVNLLMNAMDAMIDTPPDRRRISIHSAVRTADVEVSVSDAGTGLTATVDGQLFEPFVTTKANGIGIGLTIVRSIVEAHSGGIEAHNNADAGATFSLTLPAMAASSLNTQDERSAALS